ncbi:nucleotidyltransferase family protein [Raoultella terrigena]|uniref:nucleotidyltransferase family protein n=1 Tax=Raoultella terrigena TaxID=577 RepID=UPI0011D24661|nr:nucleotidyltransferase family protein [Raoultella terrigena]QIT29364.1 nucleotidyltransferase family protein [Raoultella terrigena]
MEYQQALQRVLLDDAVRMKALYAVQTLRLNDGWIGAGFVRDAVWDHLHGYGQRPVGGDVDVVWFDAARCTADGDRLLEAALNQVSPAFDWSVKNQARMHHHSGNAPYRSTEDAIRYWPETATAVAVRIGDTGLIEVIAPYGLADLFALRLRPTPQFEQQRLSVFKHRVAAKRWVERYPLLQLIVPG